jgi:hypothetical protein
MQSTTTTARASCAEIQCNAVSGFAAIGSVAAGHPAADQSGAPVWIGRGLLCLWDAPFSLISRDPPAKRRLTGGLKSTDI